MSGYGGNPDLESEHALIINENGIAASQQMLVGRVLTECADCGEIIPVARINACIKNNMKCEYCIKCQDRNTMPVKIKMLTRML